MATHPGVADLPGSCALDNPQGDWFCSDNIREVVSGTLPPGPQASRTGATLRGLLGEERQGRSGSQGANFRGGDGSS